MMSRSRSPSVTPPRSRHSKKPDTIRGFHLLELSRVQDMRRSDICDYISRLHKLLKRTNKKATKYKERCSKLKKKLSKGESDSNSSSSDDEPSNAVAVTKSPKIGEDNRTEQGAAANAVATAAVSTETCDEDPHSFVDDMKRAADQMAGFMYEPTSGLYYDCKTGYYYNAEHNLYYDGNTGCYYDIDKTTNQFVFHSQAYADDPSAEKAAAVITNKKTTTTTSSSSKRKHASQSTSSPSRRKPASPSDRKRDERHSRQRSRRRRRHSDSSSATSDDDRSVDEDDEDREDGELSSDGNPEVQEASAGDAGEPMDDGVVSAPPVAALPKAITYEDIARRYPPSLRLVVLETVQPKLRVGQLFMITYKGGSLGREGAHEVIIPDINVSKFHLSFKYNHDDSRYECIDLGSRNGTLLNGRRMSNAKQESEAMPVLHGTVIGLSQTRLLCHIHDGHSTCDDCEPHKLLSAAASVAGPAAAAAPTNVPGVAADGTTLTHKQELKQLKKRYGLADEKYLIQQCTMPNDRAAQRRALKGSTGGNEKTQTASVESNIPTNNKGFKMLAKLGWSQGQTLGKNESGLLEPIPLVGNAGKKGLGCEEFVPLVSSTVAKRAEQMRKTQERFKLKVAVVAAAPEIFGADGELDV